MHVYFGVDADPSAYYIQPHVILSTKSIVAQHRTHQQGQDNISLFEQTFPITCFI